MPSNFFLFSFLSKFCKNSLFPVKNIVDIILKSECQTIWIQDEAPCFVGPHLYPKCLQSSLPVIIFNLKPAKQIVVCLIPCLLQFSKCFNAAQNLWKCSPSVKQLGSGWEAELLGVSSGYKLSAYGTLVVLDGQRVKM